MANFEAKIKLNDPDGTLPYGLFCRGNERLTWNCNFGFPEEVDGKSVTPIISVFTGVEDGEKKEMVTVLASVEEAKRYRDELLANGWGNLRPPKVVIKNDDGTERPVDRKFLRKMDKALSKIPEE